MTWVAPPILPVGEEATSAAWNVLADDLAVFESAFGMWATGGAMVSGPPPVAQATPQFLLQSGVVGSITVPSTGAYTFTLPEPFPNGLLTAWANNEGSTSYSSIQIRSDTSTKATLALVFQPAAAGSGNMQWGAIGW